MPLVPDSPCGAETAISWGGMSEERQGSHVTAGGSVVSVRELRESVPERNEFEDTVVGDDSAPRSPDEPLSTRLHRGDTVSRYVVLEEAGRGAMGIVYVAVDPDLERRVAVKILWRSDSSLLDEARALARLSHSNVVGVHDVGEFDGRLFVAMEYVDGTSLDVWLKDRARSWTEIVDVYIAAGRGLSAAHAGGLIHRDFKPANVMVAHDGRVKVTDFGLAHVSEPVGPVASVVPSSLLGQRADVTVTRGALGTPAYMAPELHREEPADAASDQFSFCVALWNSLFGRFPFRGDDVMTLVASVVSNDRAEPPDGVVVPAALQRVLNRGLQPDPRDRFDSMSALVEQLVRLRTPSRRGWWFAGGLGVLGISGWMLLAPEPPDPCAEAHAPIEAVWSAEHADALGEAFDRSGLTYASRARDEASSQLDAYTQQWGELRHQVCAELSSRDIGVSRNAGLSEHCLERARSDVEAVVAVLVAADASVVTQSTPLVYGLPALSDCMDPALASALPVPGDPELRAEVARARTELSLVRAQRIARGDVDREVLTALVAQAEALGFAPLRAEIEIERAHARLNDSHDDGARSFELALQYALEGDADLIAARATAQLLGLDGDVRGKASRAEAWEQLARGFLRRWPDRVRLRTQLGASLSRALSKQGRFDEAMPLALDAANRSETEEDAWHASIHRGNYGLILTRAGRLPEARTVLTTHAETTIDLYGPGHVESAWAYNALGTVYLQLGRNEDAEEWLTRAVDVYRGRDGLPLERTHALNNLASVVKAQGRSDEGHALMVEALASMDQQTTGDHATRAVLLNNLGSSATELQRFEEAADYFGRALQMQQRLGGAPLQRLLPTANLSEVYLHMGDHAAARRQLEQTLSLLEGEVPDDHPNAGRVYFLVGETYLALGDLEAAVEHLTTAERLLRTVIGPDADVTTQAVARLEQARAAQRG